LQAGHGGHAQRHLFDPATQGQLIVAQLGGQFSPAVDPVEHPRPEEDHAGIDRSEHFMTWLAGPALSHQHIEVDAQQLVEATNRTGIGIQVADHVLVGEPLEGVGDDSGLVQSFASPALARLHGVIEALALEPRMVDR